MVCFCLYHFIVQPWHPSGTSKQRNVTKLKPPSGKKGETPKNEKKKIFQIYSMNKERVLIEEVCPPTQGRPLKMISSFNSLLMTGETNRAVNEGLGHRSHRIHLLHHNRIKAFLFYIKIPCSISVFKLEFLDETLSTSVDKYLEV